MRKNIYLVATSEKENTEAPNGKIYHSFVVPARFGTNIKNIFDAYIGVKNFHLCETLKEAEILVEAWNESYKKNGTYMFDYPLFLTIDKFT